MPVQRSACRAAGGMLFMGLLVLLTGGLPAHGSALDRAVLVALYDAAGGDNWTNRANWLSAEPLASWYGVSTGRIRSGDIAAPFRQSVDGGDSTRVG